MAKGLALPDSIEQILDLAANRLQQEQLCYQDALPLLYLHLCLFGSDGFQDIRQVVVDEAQDYSPLHFSILKKLFPNARYTIMGDCNQTDGYKRQGGWRVSPGAEQTAARKGFDLSLIHIWQGTGCTGTAGSGCHRQTSQHTGIVCRRI